MSLTVTPPWKKPVTAAMLGVLLRRRSCGRSSGSRRYGRGRSPSRARRRSRVARAGCTGRRDARGHVGQAPEERVALLVEALDEGVVRHARQQVRRHLRLLVMAQLDAERGGEPGRLAPDRRAAGPRGVEVRDVDRAGDDEVAQPAQGRLALPGADRDARSGSGRRASSARRWSSGTAPRTSGCPGPRRAGRTRLPGPGRSPGWRRP